MDKMASEYWMRVTGMWKRADWFSGREASCFILIKNIMLFLFLIVSLRLYLSAFAY
jgi:hypothetical protein